MNECAEKNRNRHLNGRRYDPDLMMFCSYLNMSGGKNTFETMKLNNHDGMPSISGVRYATKKMKSTITEGVLRHKELLAHLKSLNLPMYVSLSEDATNITGQVEYCSSSNQIVGLVQPLDEEFAMPIPSTYEATSATAMEDIMQSKDTHISTLFNVVMAQPLDFRSPAFCLLVYGGNNKFTSKHVTKRWSKIIEELTNIGIKVVSFSSDSDTRYNSTMKDLMLSCKADTSSEFPAWFQFDCSTAKYIPVQDTVHCGTKLRNIFLTHTLMFGNFEISVNHVRTLMRTVGRHKHGLHECHISKEDKMNFMSVLKITDQKVVQLMVKYVEGSSGTAIYLKMTDMILRSFLDMALAPLERIKNIWYAAFLLRIWRESVLVNTDQEIKKHFITSYTYTCIEINAHSLVNIILYLKNNNLEHLFLPHLISSQPCEAIFRQIRSLSTLGSTVTNCSVLGMIHRCEKIELMNNISRSKLPDFTFETKTSRSREIYYNMTRYNESALPNRDEIIAIIELAKQEAIQDARKLGVRIDDSFDYSCKLSSTIKKKTKKQTQSLKIWNDGDQLKQFQGLNLSDYSHKIDLDKFDKKSPYVRIEDTNLEDTGKRVIHVRKARLLSLYMERITKLSSDRNRRVQQEPQCIKMSDETNAPAIDESPESFVNDFLKLMID